MTFDGVTDKTEGRKFVVTPANWNGITPRGTERVVNFQIIQEGEEEGDIRLVSLTINGEKEIRFTAWLLATEV